MNSYMATEAAYKNGYAKGYEDGKRDAIKHAKWIDDRCSNCGEEATSSSWDEAIYDYDWEENLTYSYTETHTTYHYTDYCPCCGACMEKYDDGLDDELGVVNNEYYNSKNSRRSN